MKVSPLTSVPLTVEEETRIVAMLARGDTHSQIKEQMKRDYRDVSTVTLTAVAKRNKHNLDIIRQRFAQKAEEDARSIKEEANKMISKKLKGENKKLEIIAKAESDLLDGAITMKEYLAIVRANRVTTLTELVSVSKEMHNQSTKEDEPPAAQNDLSDLVEAIRSGDEVTISKMVFNKQS